MKISTNTFFNAGVDTIQNLNESMAKLSQHLSAQKRVLTAVDDPVATARIWELRQSQEKNAQYRQNAKTANTWLSFAEVSIRGASDLMIHIKTLAIKAGSPALNKAELLAIQKEVKGAIDEMTRFANATDSEGKYLFSGHKIDVQPFLLDMTNEPISVTYQGDQGGRLVQVDESHQMTISDAGNTIFGQVGVKPTAAFDALIDLHSLLLQDNKAPNFASNLRNVMQSIDDAQATLNLSLASVGARQQQNDKIVESSNALDVQYSSAIADLENLDLAKAISELTLTKTSLEMAQKTYVQISKLSLFNYL